MSEAINPSTTEGSPETTPSIEAPADYREYVKWRETGELPQKEEEPPAAATAEEPEQAKTEPQSGAEEDQPEEDDEEADEPAKPVRGGSRQRRIDRLTRENELLKQQLAAMPRTAATEPAKPPEPPGKPRLQDFETLEAYQEALTDWKIDQRDAKQKAEAEQAKAKSAAEKIQAAWDSSEQTARAAHADYDEVLESVKAPDGPGAGAARQAMLEDEAGAEILYYLGTHPDELKRIAALQPLAAIMAIGRISAAVTQKPSEAGNGKRTVSGAPKPPPALSRPAKTATDNVMDENTARDFKRWSKAREAQLKG